MSYFHPLYLFIKEAYVYNVRFRNAKICSVLKNKYKEKPLKRFLIFGVTAALRVTPQLVYVKMWYSI